MIQPPQYLTSLNSKIFSRTGKLIVVWQFVSEDGKLVNRKEFKASKSFE